MSNLKKRTAKTIFLCRILRRRLIKIFFGELREMKAEKWELSPAWASRATQIAPSKKLFRFISRIPFRFLLSLCHDGSSTVIRANRLRGGKQPAVINKSKWKHLWVLLATSRMLHILRFLLRHDFHVEVIKAQDVFIILRDLFVAVVIHLLLFHSSDLAGGFAGESARKPLRTGGYRRWHLKRVSVRL